MKYSEMNKIIKNFNRSTNYVKLEPVETNPDIYEIGIYFAEDMNQLYNKFAVIEIKDEIDKAYNIIKKRLIASYSDEPIAQHFDYWPSED